jgi:hypothetical protein
MEPRFDFNTRGTEARESFELSARSAESGGVAPAAAFVAS